MNVGNHVGPYRMLTRIGAGGMGEVWLGEHVVLGRRAAVKVLHAELSNRADVVTRFFNEARAATAIADPGIVQIFDFGQEASGRAYIVMELLEGEPLDRRLARLGSLPVGDALRIMRQVATSLGVAHARGIVHRDLKPENIFVVRDPEVASGERAKLLDFGIAKLAAMPTSMRTQTATLLGTPTYMAPEQCRGAGQVDQRADVYALGCVLFTLVTGRPPFDGEGVGEIIAMHLREPAPLASSRASGIPAALDEVIARCLAKDPHDRYASGAELAAAIARIHPSGVSLPLGTPSLPSTPTTLSSSSIAVDVPGQASRGRRVVAALVVALAAGAIAIAVGVSTSSSGASPRQPLASPSLPEPAAVPADAAPDAAIDAAPDAAIDAAPDAAIDAAIDAIPDAAHVRSKKRAPADPLDQR